MRTTLLALTFAATCASSGCMGYVVHDAIAHPTGYFTPASLAVLGLLGDVVVATAASGIHAGVSSDPDVHVQTVLPYYGGALLAIDAVVFAIEYDRYKNR